MTTSTNAFGTHAAYEYPKYKLDFHDTVTKDGVTLMRIVALADIEGVVKKGEKGGYVEQFWNLSQVGKSWVHAGAFVVGRHSQVGNDAQIRAGVTIINSVVSADADISGPAVIKDKNSPR